MTGDQAARDERIGMFRWTHVNGRKRDHLWLGHGTACGMTMTFDGGTLHTLTTPQGDAYCRRCLTYAHGWLDRHTYGEQPPLNVSPLSYRGTPPTAHPEATPPPSCWRSECRSACYYPDVCSEATPPASERSGLGGGG